MSDINTTAVYVPEHLFIPNPLRKDEVCFICGLPKERHAIYLSKDENKNKPEKTN